MFRVNFFIVYIGNTANYFQPWIDALNLHMNSLGLWAGVLPTLGTLVYNRKYVINAYVRSYYSNK